MTTRRAFLGTLGLGLLAAPPAAHAQQPGKVMRVGYLGGGNAPGPAEAFRQGLRELGWVDGQNLVIETRFAEGRYDRLPDLAAGLVRLKVDVLAAVGTAPATAARNATPTIPIVMASVGQALELGLVSSLARPGRNVTGVTLTSGNELTYGKGLELLKQAVPRVRRVAVLYNPANPGMVATVRGLKTTARSLDVEPQLLETRGPDEFDGAFAAMGKAHAGALLIVTEAMFAPHRARLVELAARNNLPAMYGFREYVEAGGLMSYGPSLDAMLRRAAVFVDRILRGAKPADLPVEQPTKFELVINLKTAKALGLMIPPLVLARADEVIQ